MELKQLVGTQRQRGIGPALVIAKFNFVYTRCKPFDDRANLVARQWSETSSSNATTDSGSSSCMTFHPNSTKQLVRHGADSPRKTIHALRIVALRSPRRIGTSTV
jgi:hypothetical protein